MTERVAFFEGAGDWGLGAGPMVEYAAEVARPVGGASDGVWLTGHPRMPSAHEYTNAGMRNRKRMGGRGG